MFLKTGTHLFDGISAHNKHQNELGIAMKVKKAQKNKVSDN